MKKTTLALMLSFYLLGCSSNPSMKSAMGNCDTAIKTDFSAGDTIRFNYSVDKQQEVTTLANNWCGDHGKVAKKSSINCNGCCSATYRCFKP